MSILSLQNVTKTFEGLMALNSVTFEIGSGEVVGLIGPNGAGKTTLLNVISGIHAADGGDVLFKGKSILGLPPYKRASLGIARTYQLVEIFPDMTALENVMVGLHRLTHQGILGAGFKTPAERREERKVREDALQALDDVDLKDVADRPVGEFSLGMTRRVEFARALVSRPNLLMLDEPVSGLTPSGKEQIRNLVSLSRGRGVSTLVVEHDVPFVMEVTDRIIVLNFGTVIADGLPHIVQQDPKVLKAYLGDPELVG